jgi:hypothetical protein
MEWCKERDYEAYLNIWEGECKKHSNALIFAGRFKVEDFDTPLDARFYQGADWGFAKDPTTLIRCFMQDRTIYIDREAWGVGVDLDETPALFDTIDTARKWPIKADNARPETISFMKRRGFHISGAKKWAGSIEAGIEFLKAYDIVIHPRCRHTIDEFNNYSYKVDKQTGDVLPVIVDAWNHCLKGDTLILTAKGEKPIKDIQAGQYVYTRQGLRKVLWSGETRQNARVFSVCANGYKVTGTADHKIFTANRGWVEIGNIREGDLLLCKTENTPVPVQCVEDGGIEKAVYDLTVEGEHEFFANGILVHNCIDALRYSLDGVIKGRGAMKINPAALVMR